MEYALQKSIFKMRFTCKKCGEIRKTNSYNSWEYEIKGLVLLPCLKCCNIQEHTKYKKVKK